MNDIEVLIAAELGILFLGIVFGLIFKSLAEASGWKDGSYH